MHESWCSIIRNKNMALYFVLLVVSFLHQPKWILTDQIGKMANGLLISLALNRRYHLTDKSATGDCVIASSFL